MAGALAIYLAVGLVFAWIIGFITEVSSTAYFAQHTNGTVGDRVYFSFTVLTTTGFGDFSAGTPVGHAVAVIEMLTGQLYLVTVIGLLIGNFVGRSGATRELRRTPSAHGPEAGLACRHASARRTPVPETPRYAVRTAIAIGAVSRVPICVVSAPSRISENGAATREPGRGANIVVNASASGSPGISRCAAIPAVPPMNSIGKTGPPMKPVD